MTDRKPTLGRLDTNVTNRAGGKKLHTFAFRTGDHGTLNGVKVEPIHFDVHLETTRDGVSLVLHTQDIPKERFTPLRGTDIGQLRTQAEEQARQEFDLRHDLTWSDWLEIKTSPISDWESRDGVGAKAMMSYSTLRRADTASGQAYLLHTGNNLLVKFPENVGILRDGNGKILDRNNPTNAPRSIEVASKDDHRDNNTQFTYLPDTPENRAGLDAIIAAINKVNEKLEDFLAPDQIEQTIQRALAGGQGLLAGPAESTGRRSQPR